MDQSLLMAEAAEALAAYALREDVKGGQDRRTIRARPGASRSGPVEVVPGIVLEAYVEDATGRFNLNSLVDAERPKVDPIALEKLERLMQQVGRRDRSGPRSSRTGSIPTRSPCRMAPKTAPTPRRTRPIARRTPSSRSASELLALPGFGRERYLRLAPYVTALPRDARSTSASASGVLLDALVGATHQEFMARTPKCSPRAREERVLSDEAGIPASFGADTAGLAAEGRRTCERNLKVTSVSRAS